MTVVAIMAWLMATVSAWAVLPVGTVRHVELMPQNRVTLQNGIVTSILTLPGLDRGTWVVSGSCTVQVTDNIGVTGHPYVYTYTALSTDPNNLPGKGLDSFDARPYTTIAGDGRTVNTFWWFMINPVPRTFVFTGEPPVFLLVECYGGVAPALAQAFGAILAVKVSL